MTTVKRRSRATFPKRLYNGPGEFFEDMRYIMGHRSLLRAMMRQERISTAFRERIMLAVTQVNGCRYCAYYHKHEANAAGLSRAESDAILAGVLEHGDIPEWERPALHYAQHWAEQRGEVSRQWRVEMVEQYGEDTVQHIEMAIRLIRSGNYMGNGVDYVLWRITPRAFWKNL